MRGKSYKKTIRRVIDKRVPVYEIKDVVWFIHMDPARGCSVNLDEGDASCGICYGETEDHYDFNIVTYFKDFRYAVDNYVFGLGSGTESILKMNNAMKGKPLVV